MPSMVSHTSAAWSPYALHIADHLKGGGYMAQVARHGLLGEKQLQAEAFYLALLTVDVIVSGDDAFSQISVALLHHLDRRRQPPPPSKRP